MVDSIGKKIVALVSLFAIVYSLFSFFGPPSADQQISRSYFRADFNATISNESELEKNYTSQFPPKFLSEFYRGSWQARNQSTSLHGMLNSAGIAYFHIREDNATETKKFKIFLYDGVWESNIYYKLVFHKGYYNSETKSLTSDDCPMITEKNPIDLRGCSCRSIFNFTIDESDLYKIYGEVKSDDCSLNLNFILHELTASAKQEPVVTYSFIISCTSVLLIFGFARHTQDCVSENFAKRTSILMLGMQATIDLFFCLYHCHLAVSYEDSFDYLMLASFWCFAVFMIIQGRLTLLVWKAQHPELYAEGIENFRKYYSSFQTKFLTFIIATVIFSVIFDTLFLLWIFLIHSFFVPQIILNAKQGYKFPIRTPILLLMFATRLSTILYFFGCPANFLALTPNIGFCTILTIYLTLQLIVLLLQNSKVGPRFFVPRFLRPKIYSYYRGLEEEAQIEESIDCIICMTPLNLQGKETEGTVNLAKTMHAPCGHKFHEDCLMNWMAIKMECPTCRKALPLLEE